jgi:hypothetical protein
VGGVRTLWVGLWLAGCATGSGPEGSTGVASVGAGGTTVADGGGSSSGITGSEGVSSEGASSVDLRRTFLVLDGGRGHVVEIADAAEAPLRLLDTPLTVEAWARIDDADEEVEIARRGAGNSGWRLGLQADGVVATAFSGFDHFGAVAGAGSGWHHVAWTYDLASSRLYLDGALIGEMATSAAVLETDAPLRIGAMIDGTGAVFGYAVGRVDEVRVSSTVRYPGPFVPERRHEADAATVLLLHLDEGEGGSVIDASANGHAGTAVGVSWGLDDGYGGCG